MTTSKSDTNVVNKIFPTIKAQGERGVPRIFFKIPLSRESVSVIAKLVYEALITDNASIEGI